MGPHYLSKPVADFAQIIYVQLQFFDHLAHDFIAKGLMFIQLHQTHRKVRPLGAAAGCAAS